MQQSFIKIYHKNIFWIILVLNELFFYPTPNNFNYFYCIGFLLAALLAIQITTGVLLSCYYIPKLGIAFTSIDYIIRDIAIGWAITFLHSNIASFFLSFIYFHFIRSYCYCSFQTPKHKVWFSGVLLLLLVIITAFLGYVLPWGQMSFWGATVIINFLTVIPYFGSSIARFIWGGFHVGKATLGRFFTLHFLIPFFISLVVILHIIVLHQVGSSNPLNPGNIKETIKFPYYKLKDILVSVIISTSFLELISYNFNLGHTANYILAIPLVTPEHIVPEWYFLGFYAILRAIPNKLFGIISMFSLIINFILSFLTQE